MGKNRTRKIQDANGWYSLFHVYVQLAMRLAYRKIVFVGKENIPTDGAVIFAPNHTNALMDALMLLTLDRKPKVFVARADIFKNRKIAKILAFLKIMPIMRLRDGLDEVRKNDETIRKSVDVLKDKVPFCIFPEGRHLAKYSSLPLSKGIFRIAFQAHELMPQMPLYILPTGLRYGNIFRFRTTVRVQIGKPINVGKFIEDHADMTPQEQMNVMKDMLTEGLRSVTFRIPDDADYDATYEICNIAQQQETGRLLKDEAGRRASGVNLQFEANNRTLKRISDMMETDPVAARKLLDLGSEASSLRKAKGISIESVALGRPSVSEIAKSLLVLLTLPYTLLASLFVLPMVAVLSPIFKNIKDPVFKNSVRYVIYLILWPLLMVIYAVVAISVLPWQWALAAILLILPAPTTAHMLWNKMSLALSCARLWSDKKLRHLHAQIKSSLS